MKFDCLIEISPEEIKQIELNLLKEITSFCDENNLKYALDSGTLIGALRHKGFIPWDDDIDIAMPYPDYIKLIELFGKNENRYNGELKAGIDAGFHFAKYCDKRTVVKTLHRSDDKLYGIWVDIFPMYSIDDDNETAQKDINKVLYYESKSWRYMGTKHIHNFLKRWCHAIANPIFIRYYFKKIDEIVNKYPYGSTKRIRIVPVVSNKLAYGENDHFDERIKIRFEDGMFYAPKSYDIYLRNQYGNYMELPPEDKRSNHHIEAYWRKRE